MPANPRETRFARVERAQQPTNGHPNARPSQDPTAALRNEPLGEAPGGAPPHTSWFAWPKTRSRKPSNFSHPGFSRPEIHALTTWSTLLNARYTTVALKCSTLRGLLLGSLAELLNNLYSLHRQTGRT